MSIKAAIAALYEQGLNDREIAERLSRNQGHINRVRRQLGLKSKFFGSQGRDNAFKQFAIDRGWPAELKPREVQIVNALYERGPMTKREICESIGMEWQGQFHSLKTNGRHKSYLGSLMARGLIVRLPQKTKERVYGIPATVQRGPVAVHLLRKEA